MSTNTTVTRCWDHVPMTALLLYTARGDPWIYPPPVTQDACHKHVNQHNVTFGSEPFIYPRWYTRVEQPLMSPAPPDYLKSKVTISHPASLFSVQRPDEILTCPLAPTPKRTGGKRVITSHHYESVCTDNTATRPRVVACDSVVGPGKSNHCTTLTPITSTD
jgi:hypothetical protein